MITLTAKIEVMSNKNIDGYKDNFSSLKNNISSSFGKVFNKNSRGGNPFIIGASKLGEGATLSNGVDFFIGNQLSNKSNGIFQIPYEIIISGNDLTSFTIAFDTVNNRFPNIIYVDGNKYINDDAIFSVFNLTQSNNHTITFDNWSDAGYPMIITGIYVAINIDVDYRNLISISRKISYRGDNKLPSYGIISNTGNLEFNDLDGEIKDYAESLVLTKDLKVLIKLTNTITSAKEQVGIYETKDWNYDNDNRSVSVSIKDDLEEWQDISIEGINYDPRKPTRVFKTMADLYAWLLKKTPKKYNMLSFRELDTKTQNILSKTILKFPLLENGNLWEQWQKLCSVCALYIYKNNNARTVCSYTYGS